MAATLTRDPIAASNDEETLAEIEEQLGKGTVSIAGERGEKIQLPEPLHDLLRRGVHELRRGNRVSLLAFGRLLTTQQAADLLGMSRPYLIRLLEQGQLGYEMVGTHRRLKLDEVLAFRRNRSERRRHVLREMLQDAESLEQ
jgi:excisionase family DNA binding protein